MTREEHLAWCKSRALEYLDHGDLQNAMSSMLSDMTKHEETNTPLLASLLPLAMMEVNNGNAPGLRRWIEGFN